uniref:Uncharacterized protein n=1 Tax=Rhizophora mucronata TaxID=61149 RepID=A0A2P2NGY1_RHIMU
MSNLNSFKELPTILFAGYLLKECRGFIFLHNLNSCFGLLFFLIFLLFLLLGCVEG